MYLITAYKHPAQLARLVRRIEAESRGRVIVHVDRKFDIAPFRDACAGTDAEFLERRQRVTYMGFSSVRAKMLLAAAALTEDFTHAVLMSEQDYPIRPLTALEAFLADHEDLDFLKVVDVERAWPNAAYRFQQFHFPDWPDWAPKWRARNALARFRRRRPAGMTVFGGAAWWALSRASVEHVVDTYRSDRSLRWFFAYTSSPDELYVHTVLANSPRRERIRHRITYDRFDPVISGQHPLVWTVDDLPELLASDAYLARKFDLGVDSEVLDRLDSVRDGNGGAHPSN